MPSNTAYDLAVLALSNVEGYWPLDDTGSPPANFRDATGGPIGAFPIGAQGATYGQPSILPGDPTSACVRHTGNDSWAINTSALSAPGKAAVQQPGPLCWMGWVQADAVTGTKDIFGQFHGTSISANGQSPQAIMFGISGVVAPSVVVPNNPVFLAYVYDRVNISWLVNGVLLSKVAQGAANPTTTDNLELGGILGVAGFPGYMQKFAWLGSAPSTAAIQNLYVLGAATTAETNGLNMNMYPFSRQIRPANARNSILITNTSDTPVYLSFGSSAATPQAGAEIAPNGGTWPPNGTANTTWKGAIQGIHSYWLGSKIIIVNET